MKAPRKSPLQLFIWFTVLSAAIYFVARNGQHWMRQLLIFLSRATWARDAISNWHVAQGVASRFVAGSDRRAAVLVTKDLNDKNLLVTLDFLGESCTNEQEALQARDEICQLLDDIHREKLKANVSVKPTQLGLNISESLARDNIMTLVEKARQVNNFIRIDMEDSAAVDPTLRIYRHLREQGLNNVGVVIQSYLYRSEDDINELIEYGARVRLCKGAYAEPPEVAFPQKTDTDANYRNLARVLLSSEARANGVYPAIATHDAALIEDIKQYVIKQGVPRDSFEFQMLYGIRRDLQDALVEEGFRMRVYVPYGTAWYPYFVRRLAERPANLWFFVSNFFRA